jgi:hypothetical protein
MKVYIGPYYHWFKPARWFKDWMLWWYGFSDKQHWHVIQRLKYQPNEELEQLEDWLRELWLYDKLRDLENWIDNKIERKIRIRIDNYDVWNLGDTLAMIALPMLYEFKKQGIQGAPHVDDEDVPEYLRATMAPPLSEEEQDRGSVDKLWHQRWEWVVDEMIWALEQVNDPESDSQFHHDVDPTQPRNAPDISFQESITRGKFDSLGYEKFYKRKRNGLCLLGKYLEALWN